MTTPAHDPALVERVARANCAGIKWEDKCATPCVDCMNEAEVALAIARPAIRREALEEAAKVVEFSPDSHTAREMQLMQNKAAAIRALMEKE